MYMFSNLVDKENNNYPFSKYIYDKTLLEKTQKFLKKKNEFSERELVQEYLPNYFEDVVDDKAQGIKTTTSGNEIDLNQKIKYLNYRTIENHFKLIESDLPEVSIFVLNDTKVGDCGRNILISLVEILGLLKSLLKSI